MDSVGTYIPLHDREIENTYFAFPQRVLIIQVLLYVRTLMIMVTAHVCASQSARENVGLYREVLTGLQGFHSID